MVCWFAGIFYLPRLFVYHAMNPAQAVRDQLSIMQHKLYRFTSIFAVLTTVLGLALVAQRPAYLMSAGWFHAKLTLAIALIAYHLYCGTIVKRLAAGSDHRSHVFYRWFNEIPVLFLFGMVILVVVKPF